MTYPLSSFVIPPPVLHPLRVTTRYILFLEVIGHVDPDPNFDGVGVRYVSDAGIQAVGAVGRLGASMESMVQCWSIDLQGISGNITVHCEMFISYHEYDALSLP